MYFNLNLQIQFICGLADGCGGPGAGECGGGAGSRQRWRQLWREEEAQVVDGWQQTAWRGRRREGAGCGRRDPAAVAGGGARGRVRAERECRTAPAAEAGVRRPGDLLQQVRIEAAPGTKTETGTGPGQGQGGTSFPAGISGCSHSV